MPKKGVKRKVAEPAGSALGAAAVAKPDAATLALVQRKLNENFKCLCSEEMDVLQNPEDQLTFRARLTKDIMSKKAG